MTDSLSGSFQVEMALATGVEPALSSLTGTHVDRYTTPASNSHEPPLATASETLTATDPRFSSAPLLAERCPPCISKDERAKRYLNARARYEAQRCPVCAHRHDPDGVCRVSCDDDCTYRCGCVARS